FVRSGSIYIMNIDGSEQKQITYSANDNIPSWSPDGKRILFERGTIPTNIYVINSDGTGLKQLSTIRSTSPTWSADGVNIFYSEENGSIYNIVSAKPDGTIIRRYNIGAQANALSASPDGKYIYYLKLSDSYRLDLTTGDEDIHTTYILDHGSLSPDGKRIAYYTGAGVCLYHLDTGSSREIVPSGHSPCWTPDGKTIIYVSGDNIFRINIDILKSEPLTTDSGYSKPCVKWKPK
ncbi:MAG: PD40 domain-containing protein, partial [Spirochaetes bacterium]|nr:PD40 domain-containing protein [Spirochaetota bacterium]